MNKFCLALLIVILPLISEAYPCKMKVSEGIYYFGHCHDTDKYTVFHSCLDYTCVTESKDIESLKSPSCGVDKSFKEWEVLKSSKELSVCNK